MAPKTIKKDGYYAGDAITISGSAYLMPLNAYINNASSFRMFIPTSKPVYDITGYSGGSVEMSGNNNKFTLMYTNGGTCEITPSQVSSVYMGCGPIGIGIQVNLTGNLIDTTKPNPLLVRLPDTLTIHI